MKDTSGKQTRNDIVLGFEPPRLPIFQSRSEALQSAIPVVDLDGMQMQAKPASLKQDASSDQNESRFQAKIEQLFQQPTNSTGSEQFTDVVKAVLEHSWMFDPTKYSNIHALKDKHLPLYGLTPAQYEWIKSRKLPAVEVARTERETLFNEVRQNSTWLVQDILKDEPLLSEAELEQEVENFYGPGLLSRRPNVVSESDEGFCNDATTVTWVDVPPRYVSTEKTSAKSASESFIDSAIHMEDQHIGIVTTKSCPVIPQSPAFGFSYNVNNFSASVPSFEVRLAPFREGFRAIFDNVEKNPDRRPAAPYRVRFFNEPPNEIRKQSVERGADVDMEDYQETSTHQNVSHQSGESLADVTVQPREETSAPSNHSSPPEQTMAQAIDAIMEEAPPELNARAKDQALSSNLYSETVDIEPADIRMTGIDYSIDAHDSQAGAVIEDSAPSFRAPVAHMYPRENYTRETALATPSPLILVEEASSDDALGAASKTPSSPTKTTPQRQLISTSFLANGPEPPATIHKNDKYDSASPKNSYDFHQFLGLENNPGPGRSLSCESGSPILDRISLLHDRNPVDTTTALTTSPYSIKVHTPVAQHTQHRPTGSGDLTDPEDLALSSPEDAAIPIRIYPADQAALTPVPKSSPFRFNSSPASISPTPKVGKHGRHPSKGGLRPPNAGKGVKSATKSAKAARQAKKGAEGVFKSPSLGGARFKSASPEEGDGKKGSAQDADDVIEAIEEVECTIAPDYQEEEAIEEAELDATLNETGEAAEGLRSTGPLDAQGKMVGETELVAAHNERTGNVVTKTMNAASRTSPDTQETAVDHEVATSVLVPRKLSAKKSEAKQATALKIPAKKIPSKKARIEKTPAHQNRPKNAPAKKPPAHQPSPKNRSSNNPTPHPPPKRNSAAAKPKPLSPPVEKQSRRTQATKKPVKTAPAAKPKPVTKPKKESQPSVKPAGEKRKLEQEGVDGRGRKKGRRS